MIKLFFLFVSTTLFYSCNQPSASIETCFKLNKHDKFVIGKPLQLSTLNIAYGIDEGGENFGKNNQIKDYGSVDTALRILEEKGQLAGTLTFSINEKTSNLLSLNCFWQFMIDDNESERISALKQIKEKFLPCLEINKLDTKNGAEYSSVRSAGTETFTLTPRFKDGLDVTYWAFYYAVK